MEAAAADQRGRRLHRPQFSRSRATHRRFISAVNTLALDIGGTKLLAALFEGDRMARRERRATDREGGRDWMLGQIESIALAWREEARIDRCAVGFGGPGPFAPRRVALSTPV